MILMYHKVAPVTPTMWWVSADAFDQQMADLAKFDVVSLDDYDSTNPRHVVITFDGVYENVYRFAFPLLRKWNYPFELFVIGDRVGEDNAFDSVEPVTRFCTAEQLSAMTHHGGRVQWHTRSHARLAGLPPGALSHELDVPAEFARGFADPHLAWFAYPHGEHDPSVVEAVRARFRGALSCVDGEHGDKHQLNRTTVTESTRFAPSTVSIIVPNYNYGRFLSQAVESVLAQTHKADEIVIIDDASTDGSRDLIEAFEGRATLIFNERNLGIVENFRKAVEATSSDYVAFLGADNVMRPDYVERCRAALDRDPDVAVAYTDMSVFGPRAGELAKRLGSAATIVAHSSIDDLPVFLWRFPEPTEAALAELTTRNFMHGSSMFRRTAYEEVGGYRFTKGPEDHDLFRRMLSNGWRSVHVPEPLIFYRQHSTTQANTALLTLQENETLRTALREARASTHRYAEQIELLIKDRDKLAADLAEIDGDRARIIANLGAMTANRDHIQADLHAVVTDRDRLQANLADVTADRDQINWQLTMHKRRSPRFWAGAAGRRLRALTRPLLRGVVRRLPARAQNALVRLENWSPSSLVAHSGMNAGALSDLVNRRSDWAAHPERLPLLPPTPTDWPPIDISIVLYNSERWLDAFFASFERQLYPLDRLYLRAVDNGSSDRTVAKLEAFQAALKHRLAGFDIILERNVGFGRGHHKAIAVGNAEYVLVSNVDMELEGDTLTQLVSTALADDDKTASWEARQKPFEHPKYYDPVTGETNWSSSAFVLMRRSAYEAVGGYDPAIFMYGEDVELSYRLRREGFRLRYVPCSVIWHYAYTEAGEIKPVQFRGSILANALLRLRYGTKADAIGGVALLLQLALHPEVYKGSRYDVLRSFRHLLLNGGGFVRSRKASSANFPFRDWDYDLTREGAFIEGEKQPDDVPFVSIVVRTYRGRELILRQAVASALQQTYANIEVVVVEDGGNTMEKVVRELREMAGRPVRYLALEKVGRSAAGNAGLALATGSYINFLDDDDLLFADHVETLMNRMRKGSVAAVYSLAWQVQTQFEDGFAACHEMMHEMLEIFRQEFQHEVLWHHNFIPIQSCLFERRLFDERGGFDVELDALEDWNLWLRYAEGEQFAFVPKLTSLFRIPFDRIARRSRAANLNEAYENAKRRAHRALHEHSSLPH